MTLHRNRGKKKAQTVCASGIDFPRNSLEQLQAILGLDRQSPLWDAILVSFDLEPKANNVSQNRYNELKEIGICMLDTRSLTFKAPAPTLETRNFIVGGHKKLSHKARNFHFGASEHVDGTDVNKLILKLLHIPDEKEVDMAQPKYRNIVLVGHGLRSDLLILRKRGIRFEDISTIVYKLDTSYLAKEVLGTNFRLRGLLHMLEIPTENLHNAGNDANFTLRALFRLANYGLWSSVSSDARQKLAILTTLALDPLPNTTLRNAILRASKATCEDWTLHALEQGTICFFDEC